MNEPQSDLDLPRFHFFDTAFKEIVSIYITNGIVVTDAHIKQPSIHSIQVRSKGKTDKNSHNRLLLLSLVVTVQV